MPDPVPVVKAELWELKPDGKEVLPNSGVPVQFNPETLKVSFSNQIVSGDQRGTSAIQHVGKGATKLSVQLWFDVTSILPESQGAVTDVREMTKKVVYFITPKPGGSDPEKKIPPGVRFLWGTFQFDGIMESLEESLEFFSAEGKPLRASVTLGITQQEIQFTIAKPKAGSGAAASTPSGAPLGTSPLTPAPSNATLQSLAAGQGKGENWQSIAVANGIENPRLLQPGQLIDMNAK